MEVPTCNTAGLSLAPCDPIRLLVLGPFDLNPRRQGQTAKLTGVDGTRLRRPERSRSLCAALCNFGPPDLCNLPSPPPYRLSPRKARTRAASTRNAKDFGSEGDSRACVMTAKPGGSDSWSGWVLHLLPVSMCRVDRNPSWWIDSSLWVTTDSFHRAPNNCVARRCVTRAIPDRQRPHYALPK